MQTLSKTGLERAGQAGLPLSMPTGCLWYSADGIGRIQPTPSQSRVEPGPSWEHTLEPLGWSEGGSPSPPLTSYSLQRLGMLCSNAEVQGIQEGWGLMHSKAVVNATSLGSSFFS